jgi:hypothetical protein
VFEARDARRLAAAPSEVWALWTDPARWGEWNDQFDRAEAPDGLAVGAVVRVKYRRGGTVVFTVIVLEPERSLTYEARLPGARLGHEHRLIGSGGRGDVRTEHRIYVSGPLSGFWALMQGRKRLRESVTAYGEREHALTL